MTIKMKAIFVFSKQTAMVIQSGQKLMGIPVTMILDTLSEKHLIMDLSLSGQPLHSVRVSKMFGY